MQPTTFTNEHSQSRLTVSKENRESGELPASTPSPKSDASLIVVFCAFMLASLPCNLDQTIVAAALPQIVSQFQALQQVPWVATSYFLTYASFTLIFGQLLVTFSVKSIASSAMSLFLIGSAICGAAPNVNVLIFGRAISGVGAAGISTSFIVAIATLAKLEHRSALFGAYGGVFALASVLGPALGGTFTERVSWRWCFYINLPIGGLAGTVLLLFLRRTRESAKPFKNRVIDSLDWVGGFLAVAVVTVFLLAIQWGGTTRSWSDPVVIALLSISPVLLAVFIIWQWRMGTHALLPLLILKNRTQYGSCLHSTFLMFPLITTLYYLPSWFQARGSSALHAGLSVLPLMISLVIASGVSGGYIAWSGRYWIWMILPPAISAVGCGLLTTLSADTSTSKIIGYQILIGIGIGASFQQAYIAVQSEWSEHKYVINQASTIVTFLQFMGGVLGLAAAGAIFLNQLQKNLRSSLPGISPELARQLRDSITVIDGLPDSIRSQVIVAYQKSIAPIFFLGLGGSVAAMVITLAIRNHDVKERQKLAEKEANSGHGMTELANSPTKAAME